MASDFNGPGLSLPDDDAPPAGQDGFQPTPEWAKPIGSEPSFNPIKSVIGSAGLALVGAGVWAGITIVTNYQLGLIAIAIGLLAGFGATWGGRGRTAQIIGATMAAVGYFAGQFLIVAVTFAQMLSAEVDSFADEVSPSEMAQMADEEGDPALDPQAALDLDRELTAEELDQLMENAAASAETSGVETSIPSEPVEAFGLFSLLSLVFAAILQDTFTSLGVVFLAIAIWEGWRLPAEQPA